MREREHMYRAYQRAFRGECEARECEDDEMLHSPQSRRVLRVTGLHTIATHVHAPTSKLTC